MQAIHAPLVRQSGVTHVLHVPTFSSDQRASIVLAGGQRVRVYEVARSSTDGKPRLRKVYDEVWGGDVTGLAMVRTVASGVDGRERVVVGFGGKVSSVSFFLLRIIRFLRVLSGVGRGERIWSLRYDGTQCGRRKRRLPAYGCSVLHDVAVLQKSMQERGRAGKTISIRRRLVETTKGQRRNIPATSNQTGKKDECVLNEHQRHTKERRKTKTAGGTFRSVRTGRRTVKPIAEGKLGEDGPMIPGGSGWRTGFSNSDPQGRITHGPGSLGLRVCLEGKSACESFACLKTVHRISEMTRRFSAVEANDICSSRGAARQREELLQRMHGLGVLFAHFRHALSRSSSAPYPFPEDLAHTLSHAFPARAPRMDTWRNLDGIPPHIRTSATSRTSRAPPRPARRPFSANVSSSYMRIRKTLFPSCVQIRIASLSSNCSRAIPSR